MNQAIETIHMNVKEHVTRNIKDMKKLSGNFRQYISDFDKVMPTITDPDYWETALGSVNIFPQLVDGNFYDVFSVSGPA